MQVPIIPLEDVRVKKRLTSGPFSGVVCEAEWTTPDGTKASAPWYERDRWVWHWNATLMIWERYMGMTLKCYSWYEREMGMTLKCYSWYERDTWVWHWNATLMIWERYMGMTLKCYSWYEREMGMTLKCYSWYERDTWVWYWNSTFDMKERDGYDIEMLLLIWEG